MKWLAPDSLSGPNKRKPFLLSRGDALISLNGIFPLSEPVQLKEMIVLLPFDCPLDPNLMLQTVLGHR